MAAGARYVFDSFALLAYLKDEPGAAQVARLLNLARSNRVALSISLINLAEALYIIERERGLAAAHQTIALVDEMPLEAVDIDRALAFSAAHKAHHTLGFADAFAAALAQEKNARAVTGDLHFNR